MGKRSTGTIKIGGPGSGNGSGDMGARFGEVCDGPRM